MTQHTCKTDADIGTCPACQENLDTLRRRLTDEQRAALAEPNEAIDVVVDEAGALNFVWHDALADLVPAGYTCDIQRVSDVEPTPDGRWTADMQKAIALLTPAQRDTYHATLDASQSRTLRMLGPYATRAEALQAERDWLREHTGV